VIAKGRQEQTFRGRECSREYERPWPAISSGKYDPKGIVEQLASFRWAELAEVDKFVSRLLRMIHGVRG
jgi:hypothetical protein